MKWMNDNKASILEGGAPLGKTKRADATGVSDTNNNIGGYSIVQAAVARDVIQMLVDVGYSAAPDRSKTTLQLHHLHRHSALVFLPPVSEFSTFHRVVDTHIMNGCGEIVTINHVRRRASSCDFNLI